MRGFEEIILNCEAELSNLLGTRVKVNVMITPKQMPALQKGYEWAGSSVRLHNEAEQLLALVCDEFMMTRSDIRGKKQIRTFVDARQIFVYLAHKLINLTHAQIGPLINRDRTLVTNSIRRMEGFIEINDPIVHKINLIENQFLKLKQHNHDNNNQDYERPEEGKPTDGHLLNGVREPQAPA